MELQVAYNSSTGSAVIQEVGEAVPADHTNVGTFEHPDTTDELGSHTNHVVFHHVRDLLYHAGEYNMQRVAITSEVTLPIQMVMGVMATPETAEIAIAGTQQITVTFEPANPTNQTVTYASDNEAVATVDAAGLVTGVSAGEAVITVTTEEGEFTDTVTITVTAE